MEGAQEKTLFRSLGGLDAFCIAAGGMVSSGLFVLPGVIFDKVGPAVILAYVLAGLMALPAVFAQAELASAMPRAGGTYFFIERGLGSLAGVMGGFANWLSISLKSSFALIGIGAFARLVFPAVTEWWHIQLIAVGFCVFFTGFNLFSVKITGKAQVFFVLILLGLLVAYVFRGAFSVDVQRYEPFLPGGGFSLFTAAGMVFVSFGGVSKVASVGEEIRNPAKNIHIGMITAFFVILVMYVLAVAVTVGLLEVGELAGSLTPFSSAGHKLFGAWGSAGMTVAAIFAFITTANAGILSASRFPIAMSRDQLLPEFLSTVNKRYRTPHYSIIITSGFMILVMALLDLNDLVKLASAMMIVLFLFVLLACIVMRESGILNYRPTFRSPFYPWMHILGVMCYGFLLSQMGLGTLAALVAFVLLCAVWHRVYVSEMDTRKSALVHVMERLTDIDIAGDSLGRELREILSERDNIVEDGFDRLVKKCEIMDIEEQVSRDEFFEMAAGKLCSRLCCDARRLCDELAVREDAASSVLRPGLAAPHLAVPGAGKFELLIARCEAGISFEDDEPPVYAVFLLVGTGDRRNFHLRALAAVAQIVNNPDFDRHWLHARSVEELRDIILLARRHRSSKG